ncbi:MAG: ATP-dependent metallopeptidase FtsH/Yme1/Tma family protein, partial [Lachnospiraceae bacterium]|nr:ATP-dependent metallopeptidase FtsH/Yme1/Tma family protein [Lachnospiraceae bacterium]
MTDENTANNTKINEEIILDNNLNEFDTGQGSGNQGGGNNNNKGSGQGSEPGGNDPKKQSIILFIIATVITMVLVSSFMSLMRGSTVEEIAYNEFLRMLDAGEVSSVTIGSDRVTITPVSAPAAQYSYGYGQP